MNIPVQAAPVLRGYARAYQINVADSTTRSALADLLGVKLVTATIARISQDCARRFQGFADVVRDHVAAAPVKHMDETGFRIGGRTQCALCRRRLDAFADSKVKFLLRHFSKSLPSRGLIFGNPELHQRWRNNWSATGTPG